MKKILALALGSALFSCGSPKTETQSPAQQGEKQGAAPAWREVQTLLDQKCAWCHVSKNLPAEFQFQDYELTRLMAPRILDSIIKKRMPKPPETLTQQETTLVATWVNAGAPE